MEKIEQKERKIKFKAWHKKEKRLFNVIGINWKNQEVDTQFHTGAGFKDIILLQWTGKQDKNGNDIFEGDIVIFGNNLEEINRNFKEKPEFQRKSIENAVGVVIWNKKEAQFEIKTTRVGLEVIKNGETLKKDFYDYDGRVFSWKELEVIGNIYEVYRRIEESIK